MPQLIVRNLDRRIVLALKARAVSHGRSAEAEHRAILEHTLLGAPPAEDFKAYLRRIPAGPDLRLRRSRDRGRPVELCSFLLDTNIVSELRRGEAANTGVVEWFDARAPRELYLSVVTVGEIRQGVEELSRRKEAQAAELDRWLEGLLQYYEHRLLFVDGDVADEWGRLRGKGRPPVVDTLLAATARVHKLTVVTRNVRDFAKLQVRLLNPFSGR